MTTTTPVLCLGEALIDIVKRGDSVTEHVGGSLLNVACGIAELGHATQLAAWWGNDERGQTIERWVRTHGVEPVAGSDGAQRTTIAHATVDEAGQASYEFDLLWEVPDLPKLENVAHLHTGSIAATLEPGGSQVLRAVKKKAINGTVSFDPNCRPAIMGSPEDVCGRMEEFIGLADVVKASDEDIAWLYPDEPIERVLRRWQSMGPGLIVATRGPWGAYALLGGERDMMVIDPLNVDLGDTVGAGDSFMAGLISGLLEAGLLGSPHAKTRLRQARWVDVLSALHKAVITSGITVNHEGAYSPSRAEVLDVIAAQPSLA